MFLTKDLDCLFYAVNFSFIETELPRGVIPAFAGIHNMKLTLNAWIPYQDDTPVESFVVPDSGGSFVIQKTTLLFLFVYFFTALCRKFFIHYFFA